MAEQAQARYAPAVELYDYERDLYSSAETRADTSSKTMWTYFVPKALASLALECAETRNRNAGDVFDLATVEQHRIHAAGLRDYDLVRVDPVDYSAEVLTVM